MDHGIREKTCCFTGHRFIPVGELQDIKLWVERVVLELYRRYGVKFYGVGGAQGFDTLAAETVLQIAERIRDIKLIVIVPCRGQESRWSSQAQERYWHILQRADKVVYLADQHYDGCMQARNRYMVDWSRWCIAYQTKQTGGTAYTVNYAKKMGLEVYNYPKFDFFEK